MAPAVRVTRLGFTMRRLTVAVAIFGAGMGLVALLSRPSGMTLARPSILFVCLALWGPPCYDDEREWRRGFGQLRRRRQTRGTGTDRLALNHRATSRL